MKIYCAFLLPVRSLIHQKISLAPTSDDRCINSPGDGVDSGCSEDEPFCVAEDDSVVVSGQAGDKCRAGVLGFRAGTADFRILSCDEASVTVTGDLVNSLVAGQLIVNVGDSPETLCTDWVEVYQRVPRVPLFFDSSRTPGPAT